MILKRLIPILLVVPLLAACPSGNPNGKMPVDVSKLPRQIYSGEQGPFHVQGIAVDLDRGYMYFSFTTTLLKTDMQGNLLGSVEGMTGHLGCMTLNPDDGRLYASIEYKHDAIGKGILNKLEGVRNDEQTGFYVAVFDVDRIDRIGMNAEKDDVMKTVYIKEAVDDYYAKVSNNGQELEHRFGCSGIDGVTFAPAFGQSRDGKKYLYVAYGIYGAAHAGEPAQERSRETAPQIFPLHGQHLVGHPEPRLRQGHGQHARRCLQGQEVALSQLLLLRHRRQQGSRAQAAARVRSRRRGRGTLAAARRTA